MLVSARPVSVIASWEYRTAVRARWVLTMAVVFGLLCVVVTLLAFRTVRELGLSGIGPASATLVNLGVLLPSLMGLLLGAGSLVGAREQGMLAMICAQPLRRSAVATGAFLGLTASLCATLGIGFGVAMLIIAGVATASDVPALVTLIGATLGVGAASVAIGVAISSLVSNRVQALTLAVGLWIVLSLGVDLALAALAPSVHLGPTGLLAAVLANPLEAGRILALLGTNFEGTALGPFGAYLVGTFGRWGAVALLAASLVAWTLMPLGVARWALPRKDL
jgi:ABC-type transport system involved in multi-copper enzyme maturation permease subunit